MPVAPVTRTRRPSSEAASFTGGPASSTAPRRPRRVAALPQPVQVLQVAQRVHALPEVAVLVGHELAFLRERLERLELEVRRVAGDEVERSRLEDEEAAVDPRVALQALLGELLHAVALEREAAEARGRAHGGDGRELAVRLVERDELVEVDIADAVAVGAEERAVAQVRAEALEAP